MRRRVAYFGCNELTYAQPNKKRFDDESNLSVLLKIMIIFLRSGRTVHLCQIRNVVPGYNIQPRTRIMKYLPDRC